MLFSCIPLPTIRAQLSKQIDEASYGSVFAWLQTAMALTDMIATLTYNSLYIAFLEWYSGFSLLLAAAVCWLSTLPVVVYSYRLRRRDEGLDSDTHSTRRMVIDDFDECSTGSSQWGHKPNPPPGLPTVPLKCSSGECGHSERVGATNNRNWQSSPSNNSLIVL